MIDADVIPYGMAVGNRAALAGLNLVGLKRHKFDREAIHRLRAAYRMIFASEGTLRERVEDAAELFKDDALVQDVVAFISGCLRAADPDAAQRDKPKNNGPASGATVDLCRNRRAGALRRRCRPGRRLQGSGAGPDAA